ncbi:MAG: hypothetical protein ABI557_10575, partial [Aureliella sp.]
MITSTLALLPQLDSSQLRQVADMLKDGDSLEQLVDRWSFNNSQELLAVSARTLGLEWLDSDEGEIPCDALAGFPMKLIHRHEVFPLERGPGWI